MDRKCQSNTILWVLVVFALLAGSLVIFPWSFYFGDALAIWALTSLIIIYFAFKMPVPVSGFRKTATMVAGASLILLSFINIPLGFGEPPYSIGDFTLLLSGASLIYFGLLGNWSLIVPASLPAISVLGFQIYLFVEPMFKVINQALITPATIISTFVLDIIGFNPILHPPYITFLSITGTPINLLITELCSGFWSIGTFTILTILVLVSFPKAISMKGLALIVLGYIGIYCTNIIRILLIALVGYLSGSYALMEAMHLYVVWVLFLVWMAIFWYYFLIQFLGLSWKRELR